MTTRQRLLLKEKQQLLEELAKWKEAGGTVQQFAADRSISRNTLYRWIYQVRKRELDQQRQQMGNHSCSFVEVSHKTWNNDNTAACSTVPARLSHGSLTIDLPAGFTQHDLTLVLGSFGGCDVR